ncbi:hypothetical protein BKA69DRAFT_524525 [Paraphysoderma sedebokerense]|nr:hypothetical protein BKA69DRAFT_524525 [Paraphysoderma sedebokerense]
MSESSPLTEFEITPQCYSPQYHIPHAILWSPLPVLSWLIPVIGHTAITDSKGNIYDFAGPYMVNVCLSFIESDAWSLPMVNDMAFGAPTKYVQLDIPSGDLEHFDHAVEQTNVEFGNKIHFIITQNCHSHTARVLSKIKYRSHKWNMIWVWSILLLRGRYFGFKSIVKTYLPTAFTWGILGLILFVFGRR